MPNTFPHDSNARNDEKLIRLRMRYKSAGYGVYFMLLEIMRENKDFACYRDYNAIAFELREDSALIKAVVEDFGLFVFTEDGKYFYSENFRRRMEKAAKPARRKSTSAVEKEPVKATTLFSSTEAVSGDDYMEQMKSSEEWIEVICMNHHLLKSEVMEYLDKFRIDCQCNETRHVNETDAKRHFNSWLRIQLSNKEKYGNNRPDKSTKTASYQPEDYGTAF